MSWPLRRMRDWFRCFANGLRIGKDRIRKKPVTHLAGPGEFFLVDHDPALRQEAEHDLILHRGRREVRGCLGRNADQISHLHDRRDDHEDDEKHQNNVDERRDVDIGLDCTAATYLHV